MKGSEIVRQLSLIPCKRLLEMKTQKIAKIAEEIVKNEGNESEKHGLEFGLIPEWAHIKAKIIFQQILLKAK